MAARLLARAGMHVSAVYLGYFAALGVQLPFWPLWLGEWGLSPTQVGVYTALGIAARVVAGLAVPALADRLDARRSLGALCAALGAAVTLAHLAIGSEAALLVATLVMGAAMAGLAPISEALGLAAARVHGFAYAQARGLGSLGFLGANLAAGVAIARYGADVAVWWIAFWLGATALLMRHHPGGGRVAGQVPPRLADMRALLLDPVFALFLAAVAGVQVSHGVFYAYGSIHWRTLGLGEGRIGALWAASVALEVVFMMSVGARAVAWLGPVAALGLAGAAGVLRWGAMTADPAGWVLWPLQGLHTLTFAVAHLGAMAFIASAVPPRLGAAAQGAAGAMAVGLVTALAMLAAAAVYPAAGGRTYAIAALLSAAGLALSLRLGTRWRGGALGVGVSRVHR